MSRRPWRPPEVPPEKVAAAMKAIAERRADIDDDRRYRLSDDPLDVLDYLQKFSGADVPEAVRCSDVLDGLVITQWLRREQKRYEALLLDRGEALGMTGRTLGAPLGLTTRQSVVNRRASLRAALRGASDVLPEDAAASLGSPTAARAPALLEQRRRGWLEKHRTEVQAIAQALVGHRGLVDDDEANDSLDEVEADLRANVCSPGAYAQLALAVAEVHGLPAVSALAADHPLSGAFASWDAVDRQYRALETGNHG